MSNIPPLNDDSDQTQSDQQATPSEANNPKTSKAMSQRHKAKIARILQACVKTGKTPAELEDEAYRAMFGD
ncbi:MAG: hypothetical protein GXO35_08745 [Gammaproteobacteria bacterium]|nr:hypothetical protein [Gammaproteobacteria bacterium]